MAAADYYLCDKCSRKAFYDANLNYDFDRGTAKDGSFKLDYVGDMAVLCDDCAEGYEVVIQPKSKPSSAA
ncbi:MAG: hypothetical protein COB03_02125 [Alteromonas sp.]|nr:MAG: hypothetical protein COB03_02125 [Alteromonas sp.]